MKNLLERLLLTLVVLAAAPFCLHAQVTSESARTPNLPAVEADSPDMSREAPESSPAPALPEAPRAASTLPDWPPASLDVLKHFRSNYEKPLTVEDKAKRAFKLMLFPGMFTTAAAAGISMATDSRLERDYGQGGRGFVRRWGSDFGVYATKMFVADFALASAMHIDPRYHPSKSKGFGARLGHALLHTFVTETDSGRKVFNAPQILGVVSAGVASNYWHHVSDQGADYTGQRIGGGFAAGIGFNIFEEFVVYRNAPRK